MRRQNADNHTVAKESPDLPQITLEKICTQQRSSYRLPAHLFRREGIRFSTILPQTEAILLSALLFFQTAAVLRKEKEKHNFKPGVLCAYIS